MGRNRVEADVGVKDNCRACHYAQRLAARAVLSHDRLAEETDAGIAVGCKGVPVARIDIEDATAMIKNTTASLMATMKALKVTLIRIPITRTAVSKAEIRKAGRSITAPVEMKLPVDGSKSKGALVKACGSGMPNSLRKSVK